MICVGRSTGAGIDVVVIVGQCTTLNIVVGISHTTTHGIVVVISHCTRVGILIYVSQCATLHVIIIVSNRSAVDVVVGVNTSAVDRAGASTVVCAGAGVVCGHIGHTVAGAVGIYQAGRSVAALIDQCLC